jgi:hypothetical protein
MASTISGPSAATTTGPIPASIARRHTCTIIGAPQSSARGLPGSRLEAMRAGMRTRGFGDMAGTGRRPARILADFRCLYVLPSRAQSVYQNLPSGGCGMKFLDYLDYQILGALFGAILFALFVGILSNGLVRTEAPDRPGFELPSGVAAR